jgi:pimeloyl-ACP methyl ester carboxylesterase
MASENVVLVHGGFVDGSGWQGVYGSLKRDGYGVRVVQNPTLSLEDDAAVTRRVIDAQDGPVVLVGHSYGGAVITEAGNDPNVAALVYIAGFAPDTGESVSTLIQGFPQDGPQPPILPPQDGFLFLDRDKFHDSFAADVDADLAAFMADSQVGWGVDALGGAISKAAWRTKPSWYLVLTDDPMIPPSAQREMSARAGATVEEVAASRVALTVAATDGVLAAISAISRRRSSDGATRARTVQVSAPVSALVVGCAKRLWYQPGCRGAP